MKPLLRLFAAAALCALLLGGLFYEDPLWVNDQHIRFNLWRSNVHGHYVEVDGYRIHYFEAESADGSPGTPLVLVHGLGSRGEDWSPMIPSLAAAGFHVYVPDLLGYGRSPEPDVSYSIALEETILVGFLHAMNLTHADLDGWSMGGWVAARTALDHPELVDRLVLDDSAGITFQPSFTRTAFVPTDAASLFALQTLLTPDPKPLPGFLIRATLRHMAAVGWIIQRSMDSMLSRADLLDTRIAGITQPTLLIWGSEDRLIPPSVGQTMHQNIPRSNLVTIAGCGHLAPGECARPVLAATIAFLKAQPAPQGLVETFPNSTASGDRVARAH